MAVCAVCQAPCRGKCAKCGARLCVQHKPASARAKCMICKRLGTHALHMVQAITPYPGPTHQGPQPAQATQHSFVPLVALALTEQLAWINTRREQLRKKQARERAYLDRRAARGTHTPTDDAYEADALLENDLLEALDLLESCLQGGVGSNSTYAGDTSILFPDPGLHARIQP